MITHTKAKTSNNPIIASNGIHFGYREYLEVTVCTFANTAPIITLATATFYIALSRFLQVYYHYNTTMTTATSYLCSSMIDIKV